MVFQCDGCQLTFTTKKGRDRHVKSTHHSGEKPHKSSICSESVKRRKYLKRHLETHYANLPLRSCPHCSNKYRSKSGFINHLKTHQTLAGIPLSDCVFCKKTFKSCHGLLHHIKVHVGEAQVYCELCDRRFTSTQRKNEHIIRQHTLEKQYDCLTCDMQFTSRYVAKKHSVIHLPVNENKPYVCISCGKGFLDNKALHYHIKSHIKEKAYRCNLCGYEGITYAVIQSHMQSHTGERPFTCKTCGKCFGLQCNLKQHERIHSGARPYKCSVCTASFGQSQHLKRHQKIHANLQLHSCPQCPRKYRSKDALRSHLKNLQTTACTPVFDCIFCKKTFKTFQGYLWHTNIHVGEAQVHCELCGKRFTTPSHKNEHIRRQHTLEKPYKCGICGIQFAAKYELKNHSISHLPGNVRKLFSCIFCNRGFYRNNELYVHIKSHIKEKAYS